MSLPLRQQAFQPAGSLLIETAFTSEPTHYRRWLDLSEGVASSEATIGAQRMTTEVFASHPHNVIAYRVQAHSGHLPEVTFRLEGELIQSVSVEGFELVSRGNGMDHGGIPGAIRYEIRVSVVSHDGQVAAGPSSLSIRDASSYTLLIAIATNFINFEDVSADPEERTKSTLYAAAQHPIEHLRAEHIADHFRLMRSVDLELGPDRSEISVPERLTAFHAGTDPDFAALYFQYGRYLLIGSSRLGGQPANLQGIWNRDTWPAWDSKYTVNINTEMNYWPAEKTGLSECHLPLFEVLKDLTITGAEIARVHYGAKRGWVLHHNTDLWRGAAPIDGPAWGTWPMGGAWLCLHIWEHFQFTGDQTFLVSMYPVLRGCVEFFLETLVKDPSTGAMVTCPSVSPENATPQGNSLCAGPTMDGVLLRDLFSAFASASTILGKDTDLVLEIEHLRPMLPPLKIGHAGQLQEWQHDWDLEAPELHHRHVSHLVALFPSRQINSAQLRAAARKTLELRGDDGTGWSLAWKINFWARLLDGNRAFELAKIALRPVPIASNSGFAQHGGVFPNLFDAHPPFQIDGNFGFTSGVVEMLLQTTDAGIVLLPALPDAWPNGTVSGLRTEGGHQLSFSWASHRVTQAELTLGHAGMASVVVNGLTAVHHGQPGQRFALLIGG